MSKPASVLTALASLDSVNAPAEADRAAPRVSAAISRALSNHLLAIALTCVAAYALLELLYVLRLPVIADEFDGAYDVYLLRSKLPYVDFKPYKTVLGYYIELLPLLLAREIWHGLIGTKIFLTVINAGAMLAAALLAARKFSARAVALALPMWLFMSDWLERSSELRVDTLTSWAGLFALFALLASRPAIAGMLTGIAFLISQKGLYFLPSGVAGLIAICLVGTNLRASLHALIWFCVAYVLTVGCYMAFWSAASTWNSASNATFLAHRAIVFDDLYPHIRRFWEQSLRRNPIFYAATIAALIALGARVLGSSERAREGERADTRDAILFGYAFLFATCMIWHKQPWPYFFVLVVPTAFVVQVWAIEHAWSAYDRRVRDGAPTSPTRAWVAYAPLAALIALCVIGSVQPALRARKILVLDNAYQQHVLGLATALVAPDEFYLAGTDLLYTRTQTSPLLRRMALARQREIGRHPGSSSVEILNDLHERPPKILIHSERLNSLPKSVEKYLRDNYAWFWGGIDLYAPKIPKDTTSIELLFSGQYRWTSLKHHSVRIGEQTIKDGEKVALKRGRFAIESTGAGRLALLAPQVRANADPRFYKSRAFFGNVYGR